MGDKDEKPKEIETCEYCGLSGEAVPEKILGWHDVAVCAWTQIQALRERIETLEGRVGEGA